MPINRSSVIYANQFVYEFLTNSSDEIDMDSSEDSTFFYTVPDNKYFRLMRCNAVITGKGTDTTKFGTITALTTGCSFGVYDAADNVLCDFTGGQNLKSNSDWAYMAGVDSIPYTTKATDDMLPVRFTVAKATGHPMTIRSGQSVKLIINDNTSELDKFRLMIQGSLHDDTPSRVQLG